MSTTPLRVLVIINGAMEHRPFYSKVGAELLARGHDVQYFLDSHYTDYLHREAQLPVERSHYFSDYFRAHRARRTLPEELSDLNAWTMAFPDVERMLYTQFGREPGNADFHEAYIANLGHYFVELFRRYRFDAVVYENVSNTIAYFAYEVATRFAARYIGFVPSRMPGRLDVVDYRFARDTRLRPAFFDFREGRRTIDRAMRTFIDDYLAEFDTKVPDYMVTPHPFQMSLWDRYVKGQSARRFLRSVEYRIRDTEDMRHAQLADPLFVFPEQALKEAAKHLKRKWLDRNLYVSDPDLGAQYFLYGLQFHPESSGSVDGVAFHDEWSNVIGISRNLPLGVKLYVKDHKHAAGRQSLAFYRRMGRIPNVVMVHPDADAKALMRRAAAVVVATTTMGYEALVLGRPVYVLGHPFYDFFPSCVRIRSFDDAFEAFSRHRSIVTTPEDIDALIAAYYSVSEEGVLDVLAQFDDRATAQWIAGVVEVHARRGYAA